jgi:hypothetical protein
MGEEVERLSNALRMQSLDVGTMCRHDMWSKKVLFNVLMRALCVGGMRAHTHTYICTKAHTHIRAYVHTKIKKEIAILMCMCKHWLRGCCNFVPITCLISTLCYNSLYRPTIGYFQHFGTSITNAYPTQFVKSPGLNAKAKFHYSLRLAEPRWQ